MLAFTNTEVTKDQLIKSLESHAAADRIVSDSGYWDNGKGCAVGCSIHDFRPGSENRHALYEPLFGIPELIARLEDTIFERLRDPVQKEWPLRFAKSIRIGADLSGVWDRFALWLLIDPEDGVIKFTKEGSDSYKAITVIGELYRRKEARDIPTKEEWRSAASAATAAAASAAATYAATYAAASAASSYTSAASAAFYASYAAAREAAISRQADKLIELLSAC